MRAFVYGTLCDPDTAASVLDEFAYDAAATLQGLHRVEGAYPTLAPGGEVEGRLLETGDVAGLDRYEGVDRGLYVRVAIPLANGDGEVQTYVGDPDSLDAPAEWPGTGPFTERVERHVTATDVVVAPDY